MEINRKGITRTVILTKRYAIKIPSLRGGSGGYRNRLWSMSSGILSNISEREWSGISGFNPVLYSFKGFINIYRRCERVYETDNIDYSMISEYDPGDHKIDNVGRLNGVLVLVDYDMT